MSLRDQGPLARASSSGPSLYFYAVTPDGPARAVVALVHGYAEYGARYLRVMDAWAQRGIASVAIDLRGHGRSGGRRGYCRRFADYLDDLGELERLVGEKGLPMFLFGHSLGGLVAVSAVLERPAPWRGLLLSAPLLGIALEVPRVKELAGRVLSRLVPTFSLSSGLRGAQVTHDAELAAAYDADPLVFHEATARWFTEVKAAEDRAMARAGAMALPLRVVMGTADCVASEARARAFFDAAGARDKTWDSRAGLYHEVLSEPEWRSAADALGDFVLQRA